MGTPRLADADLELIDRRGLKGFVRCVWPQIQPGSRFLDNWHIDEVCLHLEALYSGDIRNLIVNIPPGCMKSLLCSVTFNLWVWTQTGDFRFLYASFDQRLSETQARIVRNTIESKWWFERWPNLGIAPDNGSVSEFANTAQGFRISTTPRGIGTGRHVDLVGVDDPHKPMDLKRGPLDDSKESAAVWEWWTGTIPTRRRDPSTFRRLIVMQRLAENDLVGRILESEDAKNWTILRLPMEFETNNKCETVLVQSLGIMGGDKRTEEGELLWPERFPGEIVEEMKTQLRAIGGERNVAGQFQQTPAADTGNLFKVEWIKHWKPPQEGEYGPHVLPHETAMTVELSCDATFKGEDQAKGKVDFVVIQAWGFGPQHVYLLDQVRGQWDFVETVDQFKAMAARWPKAWIKRIEDKANGPAVAAVLGTEMLGIELVQPEGGKVARANAVTPTWRAGAVFLPPLDTVNANGEAWVPGFIRELKAFPGARNDDQVDAMTQALLPFASGQSSNLLEAFVKRMQGMR